MQHDPYQATFNDILDRRPASQSASQAASIRANKPEIATPQADRRLNREQVIDRIVTINTSATSAFLERFETASLHRYLEHLDVASGPRGRSSGWIRPGDSRAIVSFETEQ